MASNGELADAGAAPERLVKGGQKRRRQDVARELGKAAAHMEKAIRLAYEAASEAEDLRGHFRGESTPMRTGIPDSANQ
jgi:hypothetical protein